MDDKRTELKMMPGKYEISYREVRDCIAVINVTQDDIDRCDGDEGKVFSRVATEAEPHDVLYPHDEIDVLEVFSRPDDLKG